MNKINILGTGVPMLKPMPARHIPADRRMKQSKGSVNTNPARKNCIAWTNKATGELIYRTDYEVQKYRSYLQAEEKSQGQNDSSLSFSDFKQYVLWR